MKSKSLLVNWLIGLLVLPFGMQCFGQDTLLYNNRKLIQVVLQNKDTLLATVDTITNDTTTSFFYPSPIIPTLNNSTFTNSVNLNSSLAVKELNNFYTRKNIFSDSIITEAQRKKRIKLVTAANVIGYGGAMVGLYSAWYKDYPQGKFRFFNDNREWLQVDKIGHIYSAYIESKASMEVWRWAGLPRKQRIWIGGLSGAAYQTVIEVLDGFSTDWGWSWGDFTANMLGSGLLVSQELLWDEQRIDLKFSFHKQNYAESMLNTRADSVFGKSVLNRMLKDYNGQTYWLSANLKSFFPKSKLPAWLNIAVGYGAEGMYGAEQNRWKDAQGNQINRTDIPRYRQWYIAPDINLSKIKTKSKLLKIAFFFFNSFKFPLPSIGFSQKGIEWNWLHF